MSDQKEVRVIEQLLQKPYPEGYVEEWTELLTRGREDEYDETLSPLFIFRVGTEWLALPVKVIKEIFPVGTVHTIPHKVNDILKGTINVRGQLKLYVSLANLLEIAPIEQEEEKANEAGHMCLIGLNHNEWVIQIDAILGIRKVSASLLENTPVTTLKSTANFLKGIIRIEGKDIGYIEEDLLFYSLKRRACE